MRSFHDCWSVGIVSYQYISCYAYSFFVSTCLASVSQCSTILIVTWLSYTEVSIVDQGIHCQDPSFFLHKLVPTSRNE